VDLAEKQTDLGTRSDLTMDHCAVNWSKLEHKTVTCCKKVPPEWLREETARLCAEFRRQSKNEADNVWRKLPPSRKGLSHNLFVALLRNLSRSTGPQINRSSLYDDQGRYQSVVGKRETFRCGDTKKALSRSRRRGRGMCGTTFMGWPAAAANSPTVFGPLCSSGSAQFFLPLKRGAFLMRRAVLDVHQCSNGAETLTGTSVKNLVAASEVPLQRRDLV